MTALETVPVDRVMELATKELAVVAVKVVLLSCINTADLLYDLRVRAEDYLVL